MGTFVGMGPVVSVDGCQIGDVTWGPVTRDLWERYRMLVEAEKP